MTTVNILAYSLIITLSLLHYSHHSNQNLNFKAFLLLFSCRKINHINTQPLFALELLNLFSVFFAKPKTNSLCKCVAVKMKRTTNDMNKTWSALPFSSGCLHLTVCVHGKASTIPICCLGNHSRIQMISSLTSIDQSESGWHKMNTLPLLLSHTFSWTRTDAGLCLRKHYLIINQSWSNIETPHTCIGGTKMVSQAGLSHIIGW